MGSQAVIGGPCRRQNPAGTTGTRSARPRSGSGPGTRSSIDEAWTTIENRLRFHCGIGHPCALPPAGLKPSAPCPTRDSTRFPEYLHAPATQIRKITPENTHTELKHKEKLSRTPIAGTAAQDPFRPQTSALRPAVPNDATPPPVARPNRRITCPPAAANPGTSSFDCQVSQTPFAAPWDKRRSRNTFRKPKNANRNAPWHTHCGQDTPERTSRHSQTGKSPAPAGQDARQVARTSQPAGNGTGSAKPPDRPVDKSVHEAVGAFNVTPKPIGIEQKMTSARIVMPHASFWSQILPPEALRPATGGAAKGVAPQAPPLAHPCARRGAAAVSGNDAFGPAGEFS